MAENQRRQPQRRRRRPPQRQKPESFLQKWRSRRDMEFKPDAKTSTWIKTARLTRQQQLRLAKWSLYALCIVLCLVVQDVVMSQLNLFGATTDLAVAAILLVTVLEGTEVGSTFALIASILYYFSGSAPGPYCIALICFLGIGATMFRQMYWHRSKGSVILCAAIALTAYELGLFAVGIYMGLTHIGRLPVFLLTALYSCLAMILLYNVIYKIGLIGGNTWKE